MFIYDNYPKGDDSDCASTTTIVDGELPSSGPSPQGDKRPANYEEYRTVDLKANKEEPLEEVGKQFHQQLAQWHAMQRATEAL